ncbi:hypothetical protein [Endozoicomonas sp. 8E]|uniref:hypothetical protein n=1 Tax=Endozoicomonas sp. 8E TaxID=3035692 RepID=UPI0029393187|nr:hypothetical protein [Endozoicomonas sp. 8E]WOG27555.1 hypothetical protein P6910_23905 [Endozoicomonas sp. 8E]
MKIKCAAYIMIFLSFTYLHAEEVEKETGAWLIKYDLPLNEYINHHPPQCDEVENGIIGTWLIKGDLPFNEYITYHPPHRYKYPVKFIITGYGEYHSEDILYGRYDTVIEIPGQNLKLIAYSGVWFSPKDTGERLIFDLRFVSPKDTVDRLLFDLKYKDVDLNDFKSSANILNPIGGLGITKVIKVDGNEFVYEAFNPENKAFDSYSAVKVPVQSLEQIRKLRYYDEF